jgi:putative endonuclease
MDEAIGLAQPGRPTARRLAGGQAEEAAARHLRAAGWTILARNVKVGRAELDIVALDPTAAALVVVEVRSRTVRQFGEPEESVDRGKVRRLYAAGRRLVRAGGLPDGRRLGGRPLRVDLVTVVRDGPAWPWTVRAHLRGLLPP